MTEKTTLTRVTRLVARVFVWPLFRQQAAGGPSLRPHRFPGRDRKDGRRVPTTLPNRSHRSLLVSHCITAETRHFPISAGRCTRLRGRGSGRPKQCVPDTSTKSRARRRVMSEFHSALSYLRLQSVMCVRWAHGLYVFGSIHLTLSLVLSSCRAEAGVHKQWRCFPTHRQMRMPVPTYYRELGFDTFGFPPPPLLPPRHCYWDRKRQKSASILLLTIFNVYPCSVSWQVLWSVNTKGGIHPGQVTSPLQVTHLREV